MEPSTRYVPTVVPEGVNIVDFWGNAKSIVWKYFGFVANDDNYIVDKSHVVCRACRMALRFCGNTTNLASHMHKYHPEKDCQLEPKVSSTNDALMSGNQFTHLFISGVR